MTTMDNVTVRVTIEITKKTDNWNVDTVARSTIEDTSSATLEELAEKIDSVTGDAVSRVQLQLNNTLRIKKIEQQNRLLAENPGS